MTARKPLAMLLTPVLPLPGGSGRAIRAWDWLCTLAREHRVRVVIPHDDGQTSPANYPAQVVRVVSPSVGPTPRWRRAAGLLCPALVLASRAFVVDWLRVVHRDALAHALRASAAGDRVARLVVFRLALHDIGCVAARCFPEAVVDLDLDDLESRARLSVAGALLRMGRCREALREASAACQYRLVERFVTGRYRTLHLAAHDDCRGVRTHLAGAVAWRPNRVPLPPRVSPPPDADELRLLFVGTLDYPPNEEAAAVLVQQLMPRLGDLPRPVRLCIVGRQASPALRWLLTRRADVDFVDDADDLAAWYAAAHVVLVPLRAGGGTKVKTLEAFAHRRPVVSTRHGVRGLAAVAGEHYLEAEDAADFARAIRMLARDRVLADRLADAGRVLCDRAYGIT